MKSRMIILAALVAMLSAPAYAAKFSVVGTGTLGKPTFEGAGLSATSTAKFGFGGGALLAFPLGQAVSLELGALYMSRKYEFDFLPGAVITENLVQVPLALRFRLGPYASLGLGGYAASGVGKVKQEIAGVVVEETYADGGVYNLDYGALGSLAFTIPLGRTTSLLIDGRYTLGLRNRSIDTANGESWKNNDIQALVGLQFGGGRR